MVFFQGLKGGNIVLVFHRILDLKAGLDFYPGPFFLQTAVPGPKRQRSPAFKQTTVWNSY